MKTQSVALAVHRELGSTTFAWCWKITRQDAQVFAFTSCSRDLVIDGITYEPATGFPPSAIANTASLAVDNLEVAGFLDSASITEDDLLAGLWDFAEVELFEVNFRDLAMGSMILRTGTLGQVKSGRNTFTAELRGLTQRLQQPLGRLYLPSCPAVLGDSECGVDLEALRVTGTITAVTNRSIFTDTGRTEANDYFGAGNLTFTSGANTGFIVEVNQFASDQFTLSLSAPYDIAVGDTYSVTPGCRKRFTEDCIGKFSNGVNFRGYPDVPGADKALGTGDFEAAT